MTLSFIRDRLSEIASMETDAQVEAFMGLRDAIETYLATLHDADPRSHRLQLMVDAWVPEDARSDAHHEATREHNQDEPDSRLHGSKWDIDPPEPSARWTAWWEAKRDMEDAADCEWLADMTRAALALADALDGAPMALAAE